MEWHEGQKVGIVPHSYSGPSVITPATVMKVAKTRITLDNGEQFKLDGRLLGHGDSWTPTRVVPWNDHVQHMYEEGLREKRRHDLIGIIDSFEWSKDATVSDLEALVAIMTDRGMVRPPTAAAIAVRVMAENTAGL